MTSTEATSATPTASPYPNTVMLDGFRVHRFRILGTTTWVHQAWAPMEGFRFGGPFSTIAHEASRWWGQVGTDGLPAELDALPRGEERIARVHAWQEANYQRAYQLIERAFPEAVSSRHSMGDITVTRPSRGLTTPSTRGGLRRGPAPFSLRLAVPPNSAPFLLRVCAILPGGLPILSRQSDLCAARKGHHPKEGRMAQATSTTNPRPMLYRVIKGEPRNATVEVDHWESDKVAVVRDVKTGVLHTKRIDSLERTFRTPRERELGRDFTPEEAADHEREIEMEFATTMERHARERITKAIVEIAERLDRAAESVRRLADRSDGRDPARKIDQLQNEMAWLFPNLGAHHLTSDAIAWTNAARDLKRLETQAPAGEPPTS